jgi:hypothetical protein
MDNHLIAGQGEKDNLASLIVAYQLRHDFRITQVRIIVIYNDCPNILLWQHRQSVRHGISPNDLADAFFFEQVRDCLCKERMAGDDKYSAGFQIGFLFDAKYTRYKVKLAYNNQNRLSSRKRRILFSQMSEAVDHPKG